MNRFVILLGCLIVIFSMTANANAVTIEHNGSSISYGTSWDSPPVTVENVLSNLDSVFGGQTTLTLVNGIAGEIEKWHGMGAVTIMLEEIAGYENRTDFGWYNADTYDYGDIGSFGQIFDGPVSPGDVLATASISFDSPTNFGFYIDPNGIAGNRMFTEHNRNTHQDYQVTVWQINGSPTDYILGWEDLDLYGGACGDRDYQDMIVRLTISPVPEPATMLLLGTGLLGIAGVGRKKLFKK